MWVGEDTEMICGMTLVEPVTWLSEIGVLISPVNANFSIFA